jgi:N-6 DNA Methylase
MIDRKRLLGDLQKLLPKVEADLLERSDSAEVPDVGRKLREEYTAAQAADRTAQSYEDWRSDAITQAAAAWVLSCVFVRFLEDNQLVRTPKIAGPGDGLKRARDEHEAYFRQHPTHSDRDYLLAILDDFTKVGATTDIFGKHNPIRDLPNWLSGDAAGVLIAFFQKIDPGTGVLVHDLNDATWDTRFLGDLYQDLSEKARKKYALLQTPVFVEEFILDRTLDPAIEEFGLAKMGYEKRLLPDGRLDPDDRFTMIDPACGSGHFLLGSFARLADRWRKKEPGSKALVLVQRALDGVHGVDVNPYAIAIARFRLLLAALKECGITQISDAPGFAIHLACGDSLLHGSVRKIQQMFDVANELKHVYQPENPEALSRLLKPGGYHAVVANPPYITPKDRAQNQSYRDRYTTCHMKYSLAVPFLERIVTLAIGGGYTGQITANSFMKREFGKKLIQEFFPHVDLTHIIDTSGLSFGSKGFGGVPTVILFVRNRRPVARTIRTVMGIRGEPSTPDDPARGHVWLAIVNQLDVTGSQSAYVSVADSPRDTFQKHPWSIGGGGAAELRAQLEGAAGIRLDDWVESIGFMTITGEDDVFVAPAHFWDRRMIPHRAFGGGESVRDWRTQTNDDVAFMYSLGNKRVELDSLDSCGALGRLFWSFRTNLRNRLMFGKFPEESGLTWYEYRFKSNERLCAPLSIVFAELTTHNRFVLNRGGKVFKQTAPVIKLGRDATGDQYLSLLGLLNSSTACFWMKQVFQNKGSSVDQHGTRQTSVAFENYWQLDSTKMKRFPIPLEMPLASARLLTSLVDACEQYRPRILAQNGGLTRPLLRLSNGRVEKMDDQLISLQEELDWECYRLYGLIDSDLTLRDPPPVSRGQRAFEILLARKMASGDAQTTWFERHDSTPITELPTEWPKAYRELVECRIALIESEPNVALIEQPEYKRRWNAEPWDSQVHWALNHWLLVRLESYFDFDGRMNDAEKPTARLAMAVTTVGKLADTARQDPDFLQVGELYRDDPAFDLTGLVAELVEGESVPLLPTLRYKPSGLRKRAEWENTWTLQRREDAIDVRATLSKDDSRHLSELEAKELKKREVGTIPVPPKYTSADFLKAHYWRLRGKLDVPKERWVSFPHSTGEDGTLTIAWAGYDHLQVSRAISAFYVDVKDRLGGRDDPRLVPLLACLIELLPWLKQWHNEVDPEFGYPMGDYFEAFVQEEARNLGLTIEQIRTWTPPEKSRNARTARKNKTRASAQDDE